MQEYQTQPKLLEIIYTESPDNVDIKYKRRKISRVNSDYLYIEGQDIKFRYDQLQKWIIYNSSKTQYSYIIFILIGESPDYYIDEIHQLISKKLQTEN